LPRTGSRPTVCLAAHVTITGSNERKGSEMPAEAGLDPTRSAASFLAPLRPYDNLSQECQLRPGCAEPFAPGLRATRSTAPFYTLASPGIRCLSLPVPRCGFGTSTRRGAYSATTCRMQPCTSSAVGSRWSSLRGPVRLAQP
jgi:hypothetical protein